MRLIAVVIAPLEVDGAEYRVRMVCLHKGTRTIVDGLTGDGSIVGVHDAVNEPQQHPLRNQLCLPCNYSIQQHTIAPRHTGSFRIVPGDSVVRQGANCIDISLRGEIQKSPYT